MSAAYQWGRDRFIVGEFETGLATIVLNNDTGEFSPESSVNALGGDKLAPGMVIRILYGLNKNLIDDHLQDVTGDNTWTSVSYSYGAERPIVDDETTTGFYDGRTWTAHVASPGDIDLYLPTASEDQPPAAGIAGPWVRWMGRIYSVEDRYEEGGRGAITVIQAVDFLADLAQYNPGALGSPRSAEDTGDRFDYIWGQALIDVNFIGNHDDGIYDVESTDLPGNYLEEARVAARAEGGAVYADHGLETGRIVFKDANWLIEDPRSATVQQIVGTSRIGIHSASTEYSLGRIFNDIHYSNSSTTVTETDATSETAYGTRSLTKDVLNDDNTDLETLAERDLALLKDAKLVVTGVEIRPRTLLEELAVLNTTVGDLWDVRIQNDGWSYQQNLHVAGISESWDAATGDWVARFRLDSREGDTVVS